MSVQPTQKRPLNNEEWARKVVRDAQRAIASDPAYFEDMLAAVARAKSRGDLKLVR